jgi:hypothetical protein
MSIGCYNATNTAVIERKGAEMLGDKNNRKSLIFIGAESP